MIPARSEAPELLDEPQSVLFDLPENLRDIRRLNRWFGGTSAALRHVRVLAGAKTSLSLLDVATGSADIPLSIVHWARGNGVNLRVVGMDVSRDVLTVARHVVGDQPIDLIEADARRLPWADRTFDVALCCLAIHHFSPIDARCVLAEMWRVARVGAVVVDLIRSYPAYGAAWLASRTVARNRLTRHDAPLSVLRAYTKVELSQLAAEAGWENCRRFKHAGIRQSIIAMRPVEDRGRPA